MTSPWPYDSWGDASSQPCTWEGVSCSSSDGQVTAIDLSSLGLQGTLPPELGSLQSLLVIRLEGNQLHGSLPDSWSDLTSLQVRGLCPAWPSGGRVGRRVVTLTCGTHSLYCGRRFTAQSLHNPWG